MERLRAARSTSFRVGSHRSRTIPAQGRLPGAAFGILIATALTRQRATLLSTQRTHNDACYPTALLFATIDMG